MPRYKLTLAYDGGGFCGWQKQFPHADSITDAPRMSDSPSSREGAEGRVADPQQLNEASPAPERTGTAEAEQHSIDAAAPRTLPPPPSLGEGGPERTRVELRTVQSVLERAVRFVVHQPVVIHGASRTDSGVHARGQVAAFSTVVEEDTRGRGGWPLERGTTGLVRAINSRLPSDVLVLSAEVVADHFNPISGAVSKGYSYTIWNAPERTLWERRTSLHVWPPLDVGRMRAAAAVLVGEHDFAAFAAAGHGRATTVRTVHGCWVELVEPRGSGYPSQGEAAGGRVGGAPGAPALELSGNGEVRNDVGQELASNEPTPQPPPSGRGSLIRIHVSGSGFLWNMVRIIAGTLVEAGKGRITPEQIGGALATGDRRRAGPTLPGHGLCLEWIRYA